MTDTIFAVASGSGQAGVAVLRLSGLGSGQAVIGLCGALPPPRRASLRRLRNAEGEELDRGLVLWFPGPRSYTGEDAAELHLHAGPAVLDGVAAALVALGARPAQPGEFTRRAFLNGRMDLTEAEAVADLVAAETSAQRRQALAQMEGALGRVYRDWTSRLTRLLAQQEALIDFPDEDLPPEVEAELETEMVRIRDEIAAHLADGRRGERVREGLVFAVAGRPNVGKSSLLNRLAEREAAIVSPYPGTTRDALEVRVVLAGVPVILVDTAGLRDTDDPVEAEGVRRARARAETADLVIWVEEAGQSGDEPAPRGALRVLNKVDLAPACRDGLPVSALTGAGLERLRALLESEVRRLTARAGPPPLTRARHRAGLSEALARLEGGLGAPAPELRAEEMRLALRGIGCVTGQVGVEEVLDAIFGQFCIGK